MNPLEPFILKSGAIALILGATWLHGCHYGEQRISDEYAAYRIQVEAAGRSAQAAADERIVREIKRKEDSDASYRTALVALGSDIERLRRARTYPGPLAAPAPSAVCGDNLRCFDRREFDSAFARYWESEAESERAINGLIEEGGTLKLKMDETVKWARSIQ